MLTLSSLMLIQTGDAGLAFNNNGVVTGEFHLCSKETAHMSIHD